VLKYQLTISSDSPHALADLLLQLPDATGDQAELSAHASQQVHAAAADNGYATPVATPDAISPAPPKNRGGRPKKNPEVVVAPPPPAADDTDVSNLHPGVQALAGIPPVPAPPVPAPPVPAPPVAAPPVAVAPPSAPIPAPPAPPVAVVSPPPAPAPEPIPTPEAPTMEQLKDAMSILLGKGVSPVDARQVLVDYTGFGSLVDLTANGAAWAPIAHYVLTNYPNIDASVQKRAA
jgi:hypothetical protein